MERTTALCLLVVLFLSSVSADTGTLGIWTPRLPVAPPPGFPRPRQSAPLYFSCGDAWDSSKPLLSNQTIVGFNTPSTDSCGWTFILCRQNGSNDCTASSPGRKLVEVVAACLGCYNFAVSPETFDYVAGPGAEPGVIINYDRIIIN